MNWDKVRKEASIHRYGSKRAAETYPKSKIKKKRNKGTPAPFVRAKTKEQRRLVEEERIRVAAEVKVARKAAHDRRMKEVEAARAAKAARKAAHEASVAAALEKRRQQGEQRRALAAQRAADPEYQKRQAAKHAERQAKRMAKVVVVRRRGGREIVVRVGETAGGLVPSWSTDQ
jgi:hypothetical protein